MGGFYIWYASCEHINFEKALLSNGLKVRQVLIWNKNHFVLGRSDYQNKYEPCLYGWKDGQKHYFIDSRKQKTVLDYESNVYDFNRMQKRELIDFIEDMINNNISSDVIEENKPQRSSQHPTMKPIKLIAKLIMNSSRKNDIVLDLFGGSGTTLLACEQLERSCRMMEYDPRYCDVIIKRWEDFTKKKAIQIE